MEEDAIPSGEEDVILSEAPHPVPEGDLKFVPYNYLPAALPAMAGDATARDRIVMTFRKLPLRSGELGTAVVYTAIPAEILGTPDRTAAFLKRFQDTAYSESEPAIDPKVIPQPWFLGPPADLRDDGGTVLRTLDRSPLEPVDRSEFAAAVVVVDFGIAFWNRRFGGPDCPRFRAIRFLDFDNPNPGPGGQSTLDHLEIKSLCQMPERDIMEKLRTKFPGSFYGSAEAEDLDGLWHGTAMADLAAGHSGEPAAPIALFGLELSTAMVQDYGGDSLTASLLAVLDAALAMTSAMQDIPVIILLPYAFSGGLQDGTHPAAAVVRSFLTLHAGSDLKIVVSAGNLLQGRLRARLPGTPEKGTPLKLDWWQAPDDFSVNTIEAFIQHAHPMDEQASLDVKAPTNENWQSTRLSEGQTRSILRQGRVIGAIQRCMNIGNTSRLRLSLMPTGQRGTDVTAPHGRWVLSTPSTQPADLWVLRDDRDPVFDREYPQRQSHFDHQMYRPTNKLGEPGRADDPGSPLMRSGTLSPLATAQGVAAVQADEKLGNSAQVQAEYSGKPDGPAPLDLHYLVDDGWIECGVPASANGSDRRVRVSGTSAAAALHVRDIIGFGGPPTL